MNRRPNKNTYNPGDSIGKVVPTPLLNSNISSGHNPLPAALASSTSVRRPANGSTLASSPSAAKKAATKAKVPKSSILSASPGVTPDAVLGRGAAPFHGLFSPILPSAAAIAPLPGTSSGAGLPYAAIAPSTLAGASSGFGFPTNATIAPSTLAGASSAFGYSPKTAFGRPTGASPTGFKQQDPDEALREAALFVQSGGILGHTRPIFSTLASSNPTVAATQAATSALAAGVTPSRISAMRNFGGLSMSTQGTSARGLQQQQQKATCPSQCNPTPSEWLAAKVQEIQRERDSIQLNQSGELQMKMQAQNHRRDPSESTRHRHWTDEEDALLKHAIATEGKSTEGRYNWKKISRKYFRGHRNAMQIKVRWVKFLQPGVVTDHWTSYEDQLIRELRLKGFGWAQIAAKLPGRRSDRIRDRYVNKLDPSLITTPWTKEEDEILFHHHKKLGNKWKEISEFLPGRSLNSIKNRYHNRRNAHGRQLARIEAEAEMMAKTGLINPLLLAQLSCSSTARPSASKEKGSQDKS